MGTLKEDFTKIYDKQRWGKGKGSGTGSSPDYCEKYLNFLSEEIKPGFRVMDLGCGDWQLYDGFVWPKDVFYLGVDVVESVVEDNKHDHSSDRFRFICADFSQPSHLTTIFGAGYQDIVLVKDVLQHWSDEEIERWLEAIMVESWGKLIAVNNWKHFRSPDKNSEPRDINNQYRWAPIDMTKYGLKDLFHYPKGGFKQVAVYTK